MATLDEFRASIAAERRADRAASRAFLKACRSGDREAFVLAVHGLGDTVDGWRLAFLGLARVPEIAPAIR